MIGLGYNEGKVYYLGLNVADAWYITRGERIECQYAAKSCWSSLAGRIG